MKKKELKKLDKEKLQKLLQELEKQKLKLTVAMNQEGSSTLVRNYPIAPEAGRQFGNLKHINKQIARVLTLLNVKYGQSR